MKCVMCERVAWYKAGGKTFCRDHYGNARKAANQDSMRVHAEFAASTGHAGNKPKRGRNG